MGFSHSFIAVAGLDPAKAIDALGMEVEEIREPDEMEADGLYVGAMPNGWLIALTDRRASAFEGALVHLATFGPAVACEVKESVMYSEARGYESGAEIWRVIFDCENGPDGLIVTGNPPPQLGEIRTKASAQQKAEGGDEGDVDYMFDILALLARSICGYMLGENEPEGFRYLKLRKPGAARGSMQPKGPGFFARLFGRA